jgi:hypothetical protein
VEDPIRHIGKDRLAGNSGDEDVASAKSELEAEEELLEDWKKEEPAP